MADHQYNIPDELHVRLQQLTGQKNPAGAARTILWTYVAERIQEFPTDDADEEEEVAIRLKLKHSTKCDKCQASLKAGTDAVYLPTRDPKGMMCLTCGEELLKS